MSAARLGLVQLERPEVSIVFRGQLQVDDFGTLEGVGEQGTSTAAAGQDTTLSTSLDYLSAVLPFSLWGVNAVLSLNYQQELRFDRSLTFGETTPIPTGSIVRDFDFDQVGGSPRFRLRSRSR